MMRTTSIVLIQQKILAINPQVKILLRGNHPKMPQKILANKLQVAMQTILILIMNHQIQAKIAKLNLTLLLIKTMKRLRVQRRVMTRVKTLNKIRLKIT